LSSEQRAVVGAVRRIARQRTNINENYIAAILRARDSGVTYAAIAAAAGTSSQAVQEIVRRHTKQTADIPALGHGIAAIVEEPESGPIGS